MTRTVLLAGAAALALTTSAFAQGWTGPDKAFVEAAANSNMFEIESSKIAVEKAKDPEVKKFAQQMITDHTKAGGELKKIAGEEVPTKMDPAHTARVEKVKSASADDFDAAYVDEQKAAHDEAVALFTKYSTEAERAEVKAFAEKTLPVLKAHQEHVKHLNAK